MQIMSLHKDMKSKLKVKLENLVYLVKLNVVYITKKMEMYIQI